MWLCMCVCVCVCVCVRGGTSLLFPFPVFGTRCTSPLGLWPPPPFSTAHFGRRGKLTTRWTCTVVCHSWMGKMIQVVKLRQTLDDHDGVYVYLCVCVLSTPIRHLCLLHCLCFVRCCLCVCVCLGARSPAKRHRHCLRSMLVHTWWPFFGGIDPTRWA